MTDQIQRALAVDPSHSVLVQAPAGSGKTTLLVERYITLLERVDSPEEILAITFTKKAAAEMRRRILNYLDPDYDQWASHEQEVRARVNLIAERVQAWDLLSNPQRMQIRTIDSFCHSLARTMPIVSQLGPVPQPADQPNRLYRTAARLALQVHEDDSEHETMRQHLLAWCDHNHSRVESLIVQLLAKREQWLRLIASNAVFDRQQQDTFLTWLVERTLHEAHQSLVSSIEQLNIDTVTFLGALSEAGYAVASEGQPQSAIALLRGISDWPAAKHDQREMWSAIAEVLVTQKGTWRKTLTKTQGFPPKSTQKEVMTSILEALHARTESAQKIHDAAIQPDPHYSDEEWLTLQALVSVLRQATMHLNLLFAQTGISDFTALSAAALEGLGNEETGFSDLALYLDSNIEHILVDEYQDTNWTQFQLLERLVQSWDQTPHRTLFMVGDPMQSIYRFREAEVGLFVRTRRVGIQGHQPKFAQLTRNFRSSHTIVDWVNTTLGPLFPKHEDIASGAIAYAPSEATVKEDGAVVIQGFERAEQEASAVANHIQQLLDEHRSTPKFSVAVIVRARSHLRFIIPALQRRQIGFRAVKLDKLIDRPIVQDLLALTRMLRNPEDRANMLAVLRSPMAGLTLEDLVLLTNQSKDPISRAALDRLNHNAKQRAERVFELLDQAVHHYGRRPLAELVEGAWYRLGGPNVASLPGHEQDASDLLAYLDALNQAELNGLLDDWNDFTDWLKDTHTDGNPQHGEVRVDLLTMHGAKGLEWDAVIIPQLQAKPNQSDSELLYWLPFPLENEDQGVLMAPLSAASEGTTSPRVALIKKEQRLRQNYESLRLMYVATTRAKRFLWLSAVLKPNKDGSVSPVSGSLLDTVWPTMGAYFDSNQRHPLVKTSSSVSDDESTVAEMASLIDQTLYRVPDDWTPQWPAPMAWSPALLPRQRSHDVEFNWAGTQARRAGSVMHHLLERVGKNGIEHLSSDDIKALVGKIPSLLAWMGTSEAHIASLAPMLEATFRTVLESETGRWILSAQHHDAHCEHALTGIIDGRWVNVIVDRTFVDKQGTRWIIDYKSGHHAGGDLEGFLAQEAERYQGQLATYARLYQQMGAKKITCALYLPRHDALKIISST